ncbi:D-alanyl-D-alanine carboxypeptidase family protein [Cellulomonas sp. PhB150]|uniref:M15 family metallopeptidase n=1 Tax=Cellulomonas sp. PhB150 TaxID=2485188 RepID=UPI000F924087|nr:M15 family metallopeptidase [Cellulomonas sp. PhB150]ROS25926.1 LAS superfamily LD-carboxypeptidase LdcB [Cellulomonas sp. PhB150]
MSDGTRPAERLAVRLTKGALVAVLAGGLTATAAAAKMTSTDPVAAGSGTSAVTAAQQTADPVAVKVAEARTAVVDVAADAVTVAHTAQSVGKATDVDDDDLSKLAKATDKLEDLVEEAKTIKAPTPVASSADEVDGTTPQTEPTPTDDGLATSPSAAPSAPAVDGPLTSAAETPDMPATESVDEGADAATIDGLDDIVVPEANGPEDATTAELRKAVATIVTLSTAVEDSAQEAAEAAEKKAAAAKAAAQRAAWKKSLLGYANGQIPASALCNLAFAPSAELRCDAAEDIEKLDTAYRKAFGTDLSVTDSYRSYAGQVACRIHKGYLCATPGTSNHGTGIALDLGGGIQTFGSVQHQWMVDHAAEYGWVHPSWAEPGSSKPEAWHWEYAG